MTDVKLNPSKQGENIIVKIYGTVYFM